MAIKKSNKSVLSSIQKSLTKETKPMRCLTCRDFPEVAAVISDILDDWIEQGRRTGSWAALNRSIKLHMDYSLSDAALFKHIRQCQTEKYNKVRDLHCPSDPSK